MQTIAETAHALLARGFSIFPVPAPVAGTSSGQPGDGKTPAIKWREFQTRRPTIDEVTKWFQRTSANVAIVTGAISNLVVLDADDEHAIMWVTRTLPRTPWYVATSRGWHFYYRHPGTSVRSRAHIGIRGGRFALDIRADGGFVIGPSSVHASGTVYDASEWWTDPRTDVPIFNPAWVPLPPAKPTTPSHQRTSPPRAIALHVERARRYLQRVPMPVIGQGSDDATFRAAARLVRDFACTVDDATDLIVEWAGHQEGWTVEWIRQKVEHASKYGRARVGAIL